MIHWYQILISICVQINIKWVQVWSGEMNSINTCLYWTSQFNKFQFFYEKTLSSLMSSSIQHRMAMAEMLPPPPHDISRKNSLLHTFLLSASLHAAQYSFAIIIDVSFSYLFVYLIPRQLLRSLSPNMATQIPFIYPRILLLHQSHPKSALSYL